MIIEANTILNNHEIGIAVHGKNNIDVHNNTIQPIKTKGRNTVEKPKIDLDYGGYNNE